MKQKIPPGTLFPPEDDEDDNGVDNEHDDTKTNGRREQSQKAERPQIIFNGPIFLGYAPEQAMAMLQALKGL